MADDLSAMRESALLNNSYDKDSTHDELLDSFQNSYSYLYELQKSSVGYKEFHYYPDNEYDGYIDNTKSGHLYVLIYLVDIVIMKIIKQICFIIKMNLLLMI